MTKKPSYNCIIWTSRVSSVTTAVQKQLERQVPAVSSFGFKVAQIICITISSDMNIVRQSYLISKWWGKKLQPHTQRLFPLKELYPLHPVNFIYIFKILAATNREGWTGVCGMRWYVFYGLSWWLRQ